MKVRVSKIVRVHPTCPDCDKCRLKEFCDEFQQKQLCLDEDYIEDEKNVS